MLESAFAAWSDDQDDEEDEEPEDGGGEAQETEFAAVTTALFVFADFFKTLNF